MLKKLILENWKSFRYAELPIDPLTVLIGTNASGKSNAIDALDFLNRIALGQEIQASLVGNRILRPIRGGVEWATLKSEIQFTLKVLIQGRQGRHECIDYLYGIKVETLPHVQLSDEFLLLMKHLSENNAEEKTPLFTTNTPSLSAPSITANVYDTEPERKVEFRRSSSILSQLKGLSMDVVEGTREVPKILQNIFILNPLPSKMRNYSLLSESLESDASNIAGVLAALSEKQKAQVESTLSTYVAHLPERDIQKVWAEKIGRFGTDAMLYCQEQWKPDETIEIDARGMSDGTLRFLAIVTALLTRPEGSQLVIEEVDNGLHPSRSNLLLRMLREIGEKRKIDILVTTHNPALLDALDPEMIPFVVVAHRDSETGESKLTLLEDVENLPKLMASGSLGRLTTKGALERSLSDNR